MKTNILVTLILIALSIYCAYGLMDAVHNKKATSIGKFVYTISQAVFYIMAGTGCTYFVYSHVGLDAFQIVVVLLLFMLVIYVSCEFIYNQLKERKGRKV